MPDRDELTARVKELALELGFARAGVARAEALGIEAERLRSWLAAGRHATMAYMERTAAVRCDPLAPGMLPSAQSVLVLVAPFARAERTADETTLGKVARYARGRDYHNVLHKRLKKITRGLRELGHEARAAVDSMPVFERAWAERAGVGFIGKNCCLIVPGLGSHVFLAAVITSAELSPDAPMRERCGECRLCLEGCPTRAFVAARELDARRCISYLTIEHRGAIEEPARSTLGEWLFGCDECQDVCPFNRTAPPAPEVTAEFAERAEALDASRVLGFDDAAFARVLQGSPLRRARREGLARNAAIVLGNRGGRRHLPVLERAAAHDASAVVRDAAAWAIARIEARDD